MGITTRACCALLAIPACAALAEEPVTWARSRRAVKSPLAAVIGVTRPADSTAAQFFVTGSPAAARAYVPGDSAESAFKGIRAGSREWTFTSEAGVVKIGVGRASVRDKEIYDAASDFSKLLAKEKTECPVAWSIQYSPLSLTGDLFSYEKAESGERACGPPGWTGEVRAVNLRKLREAKITDYFTERSLVQALRGDSQIRGKAEGESDASFGKYLQKLAKANSFQDVISALSERMDFDPDQLWNRFCITGYDRAADRAMVRLVASKIAGFGRTELLQVRLRVQPLPAFKKVLRTVSDSTGFFVGKFPNGIAKAGSSKAGGRASTGAGRVHRPTN